MRIDVSVVAREDVHSWAILYPLFNGGKKKVI